MKPALILASESPRRKQLLSEAGFSFDVVPVKVSEIPNKNLNVNDQILDIARRKASAALPLLKSSRQDAFIVLCADTEVIFNGAPLGKPADRQDAYRILKLLSGKYHEVITAVCLVESSTGKEVSQTETTKIYFRQLTDDEIWTYIDTGEPMDKAGAYGIQGQGGKFIERFDGPFYNVVGLPIDLVKNLLSKF
ncbi:Maf family protein [Bdellovibrio bacteriovorus]|uniref:dTTP/UTP pyrophosphatase n=1 Tax=Bdellovibrio bacteriovorus (strain ATCC 15356 / DSM 50701 / NCIMB 9529 / HD100) TaxID=264462 RepID=NTPPA_BDEBA|nr:Maf family protein [Bdellovibrio bacteriovorus]Q6MQJ7.1 RecName: Full=dTTP/UTP pyrophosphatase; Short=dTTPase/UTPase; AltName: Full=Nucleoside triphosphate pyrophosphatase; AltName: Full=Nucleotide pyrophosphatase; Short=Nucleotide PPase [Bdellovibrio bacteriovorus HD100]CAE78450.1 maf protein [Bdellovibrio bacteriovorus HD100]